MNHRELGRKIDILSDRLDAFNGRISCCDQSYTQTFVDILRKIEALAAYLGISIDASAYLVDPKKVNPTKCP